MTTRWLVISGGLLAAAAIAGVAVAHAEETPDAGAHAPSETGDVGMVPAPATKTSALGSTGAAGSSLASMAMMAPMYAAYAPMMLLPMLTSGLSGAAAAPAPPVDPGLADAALTAAAGQEIEAPELFGVDGTPLDLGSILDPSAGAGLDPADLLGEFALPYDFDITPDLVLSDDLGGLTDALVGGDVLDVGGEVVHAFVDAL